jgi:hypothetical protein
MMKVRGRLMSGTPEVGAVGWVTGAVVGCCSAVVGWATGGVVGCAGGVVGWVWTVAVGAGWQATSVMSAMTVKMILSFFIHSPSLVLAFMRYTLNCKYKNPLVFTSFAGIIPLFSESDLFGFT